MAIITASSSLEGAVHRAVENSRTRLMFIVIVIALSFLMVCGRLVSLTFAGAETKTRTLGSLGKTEIIFKRADIVDRNGVLLATNLKTESLYANPKLILDPQEAAQKLALLFPDLNAKTLLAKLSDKEKSFVWVRHYLHPAEQEKVLNLGLPGLDFQAEEKRTYPQGALMAHALGLVGSEGTGLSGIERQFDAVLNDPAHQDASLQLSLDVRVQEAMHDALKRRMELHSAKAGAGLVMDVHTGELLALVSLPDFDPNLPEKLKPETAFNHATKSLHEMGSTFKAFNHALALDSGKVRITDSFDAIKPIRVGRFTINDYHPEKRVLTVPEVFMYSSNIASARMVEAAGIKTQQEYFKRFRLLDPLQLEIPETASPLTPEKWSRISSMTISYGHGIAVTPVHVAAAGAALVNGGTYYPPTLIKGQGGEGEQVISKKTSDTMRKLFRMVVADKEATGGKAAAEGYRVGGKTGTAEKPGGRQYDRKKLITSFLGAFPMDEPRYMVVAMLDEPQGIKETFGYATAGWTAAPVVGEVVARIAPLLGVKPVDETSESMKQTLEITIRGRGKQVAAQ